MTRFKITLIILGISFSMVFLAAIIIALDYHSNRVEQEIRNKELWTFAWVNGQIVYSSYDSLHLVNDSIIKLRKQEAEKQIKLSERIGEMIE